MFYAHTQSVKVTVMMDALVKTDINNMNYTIRHLGCSLSSHLFQLMLLCMNDTLFFLL